MILVTGGTGFVGRHVISRLVGGGRSVRVLSRMPQRPRHGADVDWCTGDLSDPRSLRRALAGVHAVIHAAALLPGAGLDASRFTAINGESTGILARLAREVGVAKFVHVGSAGVYGDGALTEPHCESDPTNPGNDYERSKLAAEDSLARELAESDLSWTILRPAGLYGPDRPATATFFREVARRRVWLHGPATVVVHPTHVADLVNAIESAMDHPGLAGEIINVGGERFLSFRELVARVGESMGHVPRQYAMPGVVARWASSVDRSWPMASGPPGIFTRLGRTRVNRAVSIEKARRLLGFAPVPLEAGLRETASVLLARGEP